jgi:orotate phosphoribosyltransferase
VTSVQESTWEALKAAGALKEGHFLLSSGKHSDKYLEKFDLLRNPRETEKACAGFAGRFRDSRIDVVVGPTTGGVILAFETGRQLGTASAYAERSSDGSLGREIRRGTTFAPGSRVLVVDDVMTTGGAINETLAALAPHPVEIVGIGVLVDRSGGKASFGDVPFYALVQMDVVAWEKDECPLCAQGIPLVKPGTTAVK